MTPDELTAAAGRVRECRRLEAAGHRRDQADALVYGGRAGSRAADVLALADAYLADHPADSSEPVTLAGLRALGLAVQFGRGVPLTDRLSLFHTAVGWQVYCLPTADERESGEWNPFTDGVRVADLPTLGRVRRLCECLGVPLTGGR